MLEPQRSSDNKAVHISYQASTAGDVLSWCSFFAYSWMLPAYSWAFLLTVVFWSFFAYSCVWELFCLQFELFNLRFELFCLQLSFFAYSGKVCLRSTSTDCEQRSSTASKKPRAVNKKASPVLEPSCPKTCTKGVAFAIVPYLWLTCFPWSTHEWQSPTFKIRREWAEGTAM